jgi:hypothetical protein
MKDNVIDSSREEYPFIAFINDIMTNLVNVALGSNCFEGLLTQRVKVRKTFFGSAAAGGVEPFVASGGKSVADDLTTDFWAEERAQYDALGMPPPEHAEPTVSNVDPFYLGVDGQLRNFRKIYDPATVASKLQQGLSTETDHYHYILFYMENIATRENFKGNCAEDEGNGIHHMQLGRQCGLLKNASFKKTNQQYLREARFAQQTSEDYNPLAQLSNVYDVEFTMVGNNIWIPGKRIYFDPSSISPEGWGGGSYGLGKPHIKGSPAHLLGLGGYHIVTGVKSFIESGKFETVVTARWETGGGETVGLRDEEQAPCPPPVECEKEED